MNRLKVWAIYLAYGLLFAAVSAVMLCVLTAALICIPAGVFVGIMGGLLMLFDFPFIVTELSPITMLFSGFFAAFASAFLGFAAIKAGFLLSRLFLFVRRRCDRLRGW